MTGDEFPAIAQRSSALLRAHRLYRYAPRMVHHLLPSWALPAAKGAWKNRKQVQSVWNTLITRLFGEKRSLAFTGMPGVGKTVLLDHMTGKAFKPGYEPPRQSEAAERGSFAAGGKRLALTVVPGQDSAPRAQALNSLFRGAAQPDGIVHVVAHGFVALRRRDAIQVLLDHGRDTLKKFLEYQRGQELDDLDETCREIRKAFQSESGRSGWLWPSQRSISTNLLCLKRKDTILRLGKAPLARAFETLPVTWAPTICGGRRNPCAVGRRISPGTVKP